MGITQLLRYEIKRVFNSILPWASIGIYILFLWINTEEYRTADIVFSMLGDFLSNSMPIVGIITTYYLINENMNGSISEMIYSGHSRSNILLKNFISTWIVNFFSVIVACLGIMLFIAYTRDGVCSNADYSFTEYSLRAICSILVFSALYSSIINLFVVILPNLFVVFIQYIVISILDIMMLRLFEVFSWNLKWLPFKTVSIVMDSNTSNLNMFCNMVWLGIITVVVLLISVFIFNKKEIR